MTTTAGRVVLLLIMVIGLGSTAMGKDADRIRTETRTVIGKILIEFDDRFNSKSVYVLDGERNEKIWIDTLNFLKGPFRDFAIQAGAAGQTVSLNGLVEYWTDGIILRPQNITGYSLLE
jgi:hypothetical protein